MAEKNNFKISVVIPAFNAEDYIPTLLKGIETQTLLPEEIVIVDSSETNRTAEIVKEWKGIIPIHYHKVDFAYPGQARNIGVTLAKAEWIAFIDCRTFPERNWLETCVAVARKSNVGFVGALVTSEANSHYGQILCAATHGAAPFKPLVGSLVSKRIFKQTGGFLSDIRSGEDIDWLNRMEKLRIKMEYVTTPLIKYSGFPSSLIATIKKWHIYTTAVAKIEVYNNQKKLYFFILFFLLFVVVYKWNALFAGWDERSIYYVPNITKLFIAFSFALYVFYRGIIRPLQLKVKLSFLLPWRWFEISFVGFCLDITKAPGLIWGAILLLRRRLEIIIKKQK